MKSIDSLELYFDACYNPFMNKLILSLILLVFAASGCFWPFRTQQRVPPSAPAISDGVSVEVLDPSPLRRGGKFYFMPFSAGDEAEAGAVVDRVALMMIKGASDALAEGGGFVLVSGDDAVNADIVLSGHIEQLKSLGHFKKKLVMKARGDVRIQNPKGVQGAVVALVFSHSEARDRGKGMDQAAYNMGYAIAKKLMEPGS